MWRGRVNVPVRVCEWARARSLEWRAARGVHGARARNAVARPGGGRV